MRTPTEQLEDDLARYREGAVICALLHYITAFGPVLLSGYAALGFELLGGDNKASAVSAAMAAFLATVGAFAGLREKWHANRDAVYSLRILGLAAIEDTELRAGLIKVQQAHASAWRRAT